MSDSAVQRDLGKLEASQEASNEKIEKLEKRLEQVDKNLQEVLLVLKQREGGTKYLFAALTIATMVGGLIDRLLTWFKVF